MGTMLLALFSAGCDPNKCEPMTGSNNRLACFAALLLSLAPNCAMAWGREGHQIIARIAAPRLSDAAKHDIEALLGSPVADTLAAASLWADEVRPGRRETAPWHYVNIELETQGYVAARDCLADDCVVAQIERDAS